MDEYISSTTVDTDDELHKLQEEAGVTKTTKLDDMEFQENNEAVAKTFVDEEDVLDSTGGAHDAFNGLKAEEDPPRKAFSESPSPGPEPRLATQPEAPLPTHSAVVESTEEQTKAEEIEYQIPEPEAEHVIVKPPPPAEKTVIEPETEETAFKPETEETAFKPETENTVLEPDTEDLIVKPEAPVEAPVRLEESPSSDSAVSHKPIIPSSASSQPLPLPSAANLDAPYLLSQDSIKAMDETSKDLFSSKASWYETDMPSSKADVEDDFQFDVKSAAPKKSFEGFASIGDFSSGASHFSESASDSRAGKMSESPTPDLVQYTHECESQESTSCEHRDEPLVDLVHMADAVVEPSDPLKSLPTSAQDDGESSAPPSLPDILKLSPLNPDKEDSGSSEGSPDSERSPVLELQIGPPNASHSPLSPFSFESKILLLKEMADETEARFVEKKTHESPSQEQIFGSFDLVKEAETTTQCEDLRSTMEVEEKEWMFPSKVSVVDRSAYPYPPASMNRPPSPPTKSLIPDSLSPVLDAVAKSPASFRVETESKCVTLEREVKGLSGEEPEVGDDASEHEVSSEEFEFVERPPKGVIDEFLETLDNSKFAKERGVERDMFADIRQEKQTVDVASELPDMGSPQSSYLLSQPTSRPLSHTFLSDTPFDDFKHRAQESSALSHGPLTHPIREELEKPIRLHEMDKDGTGSAPVQPQASKPPMLPNLSAEAVVDLLYWRDIKVTGVAFGASLFLLLSLTVCSIVSVCSYVALVLLSVTVAFRIYKGILQAVQKSDEGHPFKVYLDQDVGVSEEVVHKYSDMALERLNVAIKELRRLFLVEDLVDSLKFAVGMWVLTYLGALFNGLTLLILGLIGLFSCPVIYEKNQAQIDHYVALANNQFKDIAGKVQAKVPGLKRKTE